MRTFLLVTLLAVGAMCSSLQFPVLPKSINIKTSGSIGSSKLSDLNENILGLSTVPVKGVSIESDLFSRPRAMAVVSIEGIDNVGSGETYSLNNDGFDSVALDQSLALVFGADREFATVSKDGISGSGISQVASEQKVDSSVIKTKIEGLRSELENIYRLAAAISSQSTKFSASSSADLYRVTIKSLAGLNLYEEDKETAVSDIEAAIAKLSSALTSVYGEQVVVEIVSLSSAVQTKNVTLEDEGHHIAKRAASDKSPEQVVRENLNVSVFTGSDYPAIFAIFLGLTIALILAVIYTTVGMMTMDPGKDSIIYRMTTTRMKKD